MKADKPLPGREIPVVLFDGVCNLCNSSVNFIIDHDPKARIMLAALQQPEAVDLLNRCGVTLSGMDSVLLVHHDRVHMFSDAALKIAALLSGWPRIMPVFFIIPRFLRDPVYKFIANNRYRWFGKRETCRVPTPELKKRFL